jgi:hypothetical protein
MEDEFRISVALGDLYRRLAASYFMSDQALDGHEYRLVVQEIVRLRAELEALKSRHSFYRQPVLPAAKPVKIKKARRSPRGRPRITVTPKSDAVEPGPVQVETVEQEPVEVKEVA